MIIVKKYQVPSGQWQYTEESTAYKMTSMTYDNLFSLIESHRIANSIPISVGWRQEVIDKMCETLPEDFYIDEDAPNVEPNIGVRDVKTFMKVMVKHVAEGGEMVDQEVADTRSETCSGCIKNVNVSGCKGNT